jgi:rhodanese-related sulfurtransferase
MEITAQELSTALNTGQKLRLVDVREPDEWQICHLSGALLIPLSEFPNRAPLELKEDASIVVYCHHGMRSARAQQFLISKGFSDVKNLRGGIDAWATQIDPQMPRY